MKSQCRNPIFFSLTLSNQPQTMLTQGKGRRKKIITCNVTPIFCISIVFSFSWELKCPQEKLKTMLMQNIGVTNKEYYDMLWYFLQWSNFARTTGQERTPRDQAGSCGSRLDLVDLGWILWIQAGCFKFVHIRNLQCNLIALSCELQSRLRTE